MVNISKKLLILLIILITIIFLGYIMGFIWVLIGLASLIILYVKLIIKNVDRIIIYIYRARPAFNFEFKEVKEKIHSLSERNGVPAPSLYITKLALPGSFVIGKDINNTILIFPERLSGILKNEELDAAIAYNIIQINNSIGKRTFAVMMASILTMSSSTIRWGAVFTGFGDYNDPAPKFFGLLVMGLVAPPAAALMNSVEMEEMDMKAVKLSRRPDSYIMAIRQLENNNVMEYPSLGFLCIVDAQKETFFESLFNSHQSFEKREKKLMEGMRNE